MEETITAVYLFLQTAVVKVKSYSLIGLKHSGVTICSFRWEIASLPQLRGSPVWASITNIYLLLHGFHTLQIWQTDCKWGKTMHVKHSSLTFQSRTFGAIPVRWPWTRWSCPVFPLLWRLTLQSAWPSWLPPPHLPWSSFQCQYGSPLQDPIGTVSKRYIDWITMFILLLEVKTCFIGISNIWTCKERHRKQDIHQTYNESSMTGKHALLLWKQSVWLVLLNQKKYYYCTSFMTSDREPRDLLNTSDVFVASASMDFYEKTKFYT